MKNVVIKCVILMVILFLINLVLHQVSVPQNATDLALQQMNEDGSREQLRVIERLSNYITPVLCIVGVVGIATIGYRWRREARKVRKERTVP